VSVAKLGGEQQEGRKHREPPTQEPRGQHDCRPRWLKRLRPQLLKAHRHFATVFTISPFSRKRHLIVAGCDFPALCIRLTNEDIIDLYK
jgi:hypothetical protein